MTSLLAEARRKWLYEELKTSQAVRLSVAAKALGVSEMTVRRDLDDLERSGIARRVHGGAVYAGPVSFEGRDRLHASEKMAIAKKLLPHVPQEGVIAIDSSTTMHRLAQLISAPDELVVVTNGLITFKVLQERPGITAILTGGASDRRSDSLVGPIAAASLENIVCAAYFTSASALDEHNSYESTFEEAQIKRAFARAAERTYMGVHMAKLGYRAAAVALESSSIDILATELDPTHRDLAKYRTDFPGKML